MELMSLLRLRKTLLAVTQQLEEAARYMMLLQNFTQGTDCSKNLCAGAALCVHPLLYNMCKNYMYTRPR